MIRQKPYHGGQSGARRIALAGHLGHEATMNSPPKAEGAAQAIQEALALHRQGKLDLAMQRYVAILQ